MRTGKVAVFTRPGEPIKIVEEEVHPPAPDEILVRVSIAGICGSDVHRLKGDVPAKSSSTGVCFGHEAVGIIESLGAKIKTDSVGTSLSQGDTLYWMPLAPCGTCSGCSSSNPLQCQKINWPPSAGTPNGAGFRQYATLSENCVYIRVPSGVAAADNIITFGCGMPTALRGLKQLRMTTTTGIGPDDDVVIQGSGPVGLACTLLASLAGARSIIVIGDPDHRLDVAASLGATCTMSVTQTRPEARLVRVKELTADRGGACIVIEAAGTASAFAEGINFLGPNGQYLILGLYSGSHSVPIDPVRINNYNLQIIGSLGLDVASYKKTVDIASEHGERLQFAKLITHRFPLDRLEEALGLVGKGVPIKAVIIPS